MTRKLPFAFVALLLVTTPAVAAETGRPASEIGTPTAESRISGLVREIRPDGKLVLEEQGPWKGPGTGVISRVVTLTPDTMIRVVRPTGRWSSLRLELDGLVLADQGGVPAQVAGRQQGVLAAGAL